ncbi:hypothetical protein LCGC14_1670730 [marine sediment metagenome]|uniref:Uncharacterized protein n=1 Tax=marine sediment metagenome TaxID=412755 RepID=A0A0F9HS95_9ZZZZ
MIIHAIRRIIGLMAVVTLVFILKPAHAATIEGLVWMDSPCEGCITVIKDLGDGNIRVIYMERNGNDLKVISIKKLHCTAKTTAIHKRDFCDYKIITEYKKTSDDNTY